MPPDALIIVAPAADFAEGNYITSAPKRLSKDMDAQSLLVEEVQMKINLSRKYDVVLRPMEDQLLTEIPFPPGQESNSG